MNTLPYEVLEQIFEHLLPCELCIVSQVCKTWLLLSNHRKTLAISSAQNVDNPHQVIERFPYLSKLSILLPGSTKDNYWSKKHDAQIHRLAQAFKGHPRLQSLHSNSDLILKGALNCTLLKELRVVHVSIPPIDEGLEDSLRNIALILQKLPQLTLLDVTRPICILPPLHSRCDQAYLLRTLTIHGISTNSLAHLLQLIEQSYLRRLESLHLITENLVPTTFIAQLALGCPTLTSLTLEHARLCSGQIVELTESPLRYSLRTIILRNVEGVLPRSSAGPDGYSTIITRMAMSMQVLQKLELSHCMWYYDDHVVQEPVDLLASKLTDLIIFDLGSELTVSLQLICDCFPCLQSLRMHAFYSDLASISCLQSIPSLRQLEIRCRMQSQVDFNVACNSIEAPLLASSSIWSPPPHPQFIKDILVPWWWQLRSLVLNYPSNAFVAELQGVCPEPLTFCNLQSLQVHAMGPGSGRVAQSMIIFLAGGSTKLQHVHMEAGQFIPATLDEQVISTLTTSAKGLQSLVMKGYRIDPDTLASMKKWARSLVYLQLCGHAIDIYTKEHHDQVMDLLDAARKLQLVTVSMDKLSAQVESIIDMYKPKSIPLARTDSAVDLDEDRGCSMARDKRCDYGKFLKLHYPWVESIYCTKVACHSPLSLIWRLQG